MSIANFLPNAGITKKKFTVAKVHAKLKIKVLILYMDLKYLDQHFFKSIEGRVYLEWRLKKYFEGAK